jgi:hypothetical protein
VAVRERRAKRERDRRQPAHPFAKLRAGSERAKRAEGSLSKTHSVAAIGDSYVIPSPSSGQALSEQSEPKDLLSERSEPKDLLARRAASRRSETASSSLRLRSGQAPRGPGSKLICGRVDATTLGPGLRRDDHQSSRCEATAIGKATSSLRQALQRRSSDRMPMKIAYCNM